MAAKVPTLLLVLVKTALPLERTRLAAVTAPADMLVPCRVIVLLVAVIGERRSSAPP